MAARYKFYFDGALITEPANWDKMTTGIRRDESSRGLLITQDAQLQFTGAEYDYLYSKLVNDGFCGFTELEILENCTGEGDYEPVYKGIIYTSDCEFTLDKCTTLVRIQDNSYFAKINGRKSNDCYINVGRSINDIAITATPTIDLQLFYPCGGNTIIWERKGYRVFDVMTFLISFMTDNEVAFDSPVLNDGGDFEGLCIASGKQLRDFTELTYINKFSFSKALDNLWKKLNLAFYVDESGAKPKLVLDYTNNLYSDTEILSLADVPGIVVKTKTDKLYSAVRLGTTETLETDLLCDGSGDYTTGAFPEGIAFIGCKDETFNVLGKCNIDRTLDLSTDWIVSSNVIQYILNDADAQGDESYDDKIVLIDCIKDSSDYIARASNNIDGDPTVTAFYNVRLYNDAVAKMFFGSVPLSIVEYLGTKDDLFWAKKTPYSVDPTITLLGPSINNEPVQFDNDYIHLFIIFLS